MSAKGQTSDLISLEFGADDFIGKPFSIKEVINHIHRLLRKRENGDKA